MKLKRITSVFTCVALVLTVFGVILSDAVTNTSLKNQKTAVRFDPPRSIVTVPVKNGISVKWSSVRGVSGRYRYRLFIKNGSVYKTVATTAKTKYVDKKIASGSSRSYAVRIYDVKTGKPLSKFSSASKAQQWVKTPTINYARYSRDKKGVVLEWNTVKTAGAYRLFYLTTTVSGKSVWNNMATLDAGTTSYIDTDLGEKQSWRYTIRCMNSSATSYISSFNSSGIVAQTGSAQKEYTDFTGTFKYMITDDSKVKITGYLSGEKKLSVPSSLDGRTVTEIGKRVFENNTVLRSVSLGSGLETIGWWAFYGCSNLSSVTLPDGLETISYAAFLNCPKLLSLSIPASVTSIGEFALATNCSVKKNYEDRLNLRRLAVQNYSVNHSFEIITDSETSEAYKYAAENELRSTLTVEKTGTASSASDHRSPLMLKTLYSTGDSVAKGTGTDINTYNRHSYAYYLRDKYGMTLTTTAESSITLAKRPDYVGTEKRSILERIEELCKSGVSYDAIILDGGFNDVFKRVELGEITPDNERSNNFDVYTTAGALEKICYLLTRYYAATPKLFVLCHKIETSKLQARYFSVIRRVLNKWGIKYIDLSSSDVISLTGDDSALNDNYFQCRDKTNDHIHPNSLAHYTIYGPPIASALETQFKNAPAIIKSSREISRAKTPRTDYALIRTVKLNASNVSVKVSADTRSVSVIKVYNTKDYVEALIKIEDTDITKTMLTTSVAGKLFTTMVTIGENASAPSITSVKKTAAGIEIYTAGAQGCHYYNIYRRTGGTGSYQRINGEPLSGTACYVDATVVRNQTYFYAVRGVTGTGEPTTEYGEYTEPVTVGQRLNINCMKLKRISISPGSARLSWNDDSYLHRYTVLYMDLSTDSVWHVYKTLKGTSCTINDASVLLPGHSYRFAVRAAANTYKIIRNTKVYDYMSGHIPSGIYML